MDVYIYGSEKQIDAIMSHLFVSPYQCSSFKEGIEVTDSGGHEIFEIKSNLEISAFTGTGKQDSTHGLTCKSSFPQPCGIIVELDNVLYITDAQDNTIRIYSSLNKITKF